MAASSSSDSCGYDATFTSEVAEYLKCIVCHLVLRQPIQIMKCGHRFCEACFGQMKEYAKNLNADLCCPIDNDIIDLNKVFEDTGMARIIGNLKVLCSNNGRGCTWSDDLRDLKAHEEKCQYKVIENTGVQQVEENSRKLNELHERMAKCEQGLMEKEKDVAFLKLNLQEMKKLFNQKQEEVDFVTTKSINIENELRENIEWKKNIEKDIEITNLKNQLLERELSDTRKIVIENSAKEIQPTSGNAIDSSVFKVKELDSSLLNSLTLEVVEVDAVMDERKTYMTGAVIDENSKSKKKKNKKEKKKEKKSVKVPDEANDATNPLKGCTGNVNSENRKLPMKPSEEVPNTSRAATVEELEELEELNIMFSRVKDNVDILGRLLNITFCDYPHLSTQIDLEWNLHNYHHCYSIGKQVYSPIFYTRVRGYAFKLSVKWSGKEKDVGLYLHLCHGIDYDDRRETFNVEWIQLVMGDKLSSNGVCSGKRFYNKLNDDTSFNFANGENTSKGRGFSKFLTEKEKEEQNYDDYVVDNILHIECMFTPSMTLE